MRRRTFLALAATGLATGTAGCSSIGSDGDDGTGGTDETGGTDTATNARTTDAAETMTATPTTSATMNGETTTTTTTTTGQRTAIGTTGGNNSSDTSDTSDSASGVSGQVKSVPDGLAVTERRFYSMQFSTGVRGILKNVSESPFEYVEVRATFYDAEGTRLDTGIDYDSGLAAGATWPFDVVYRGSKDPAQIARYTLMVDTSPF